MVLDGPSSTTELWGSWEELLATAIQRGAVRIFVWSHEARTYAELPPEEWPEDNRSQ